MRVERNMHSISEHEYHSLTLVSNESLFSFQNRFSGDIITDQWWTYSINPIITTQARFERFSVIDAHDSPYAGYEQISYVIDLYASPLNAARIINLDDISEYMSGRNLENYSGLEDY